MRKWKGLTAALLLSTAVFTGCTNEGSEQKDTQAAAEASSGVHGDITFITHRSDLLDNGTFDKYEKEFKKKYPAVSDVKVVSLKDYQTDIRVRILSNNYGDALILPNNFEKKNFPEYFEPLDDMKLFDNLYYANGQMHDDKRYAITVGVSATGLVYNKKAFSTAGITSPPKTLQEFYEACEKLKQAGITPMNLNYGSGWTLTQWGAMMVPVMNGHSDALNFMIDSDAPFQKDNEIGQAMDIIRTLIDKGYAEKDLYTDHWEDSKLSFAKEESAMFYIGNWIIPQILDAGKDAGIKPEDIGFMPLPASTTGTMNATLSSDAWYVINKNSKNKETTKAWIKFLLEESSIADDTGFIPTLRTRDSNLAQLNEFLSYKPNLIEDVSMAEAYYTTAGKAGFDIWETSFIQKAAVAPDIRTFFGEWNAKWAEARR
ncbi:ABC transporter substrate-binding protein [Paenibacillus sp. YPG26]|uniref:ABC transporter substrate-binding protein n=1 Tax=Paenibacillus sp. YPG26 TaxID=2878915 RepID=UPI00203D8B0D|nr:ABC transporter substrate-binding protein [Paenibacillus sp. YPG26]USB32982.1 ABC transporter substrate-binding protein [Paenibacillus sp. YPG26]